MGSPESVLRPGLIWPATKPETEKSMYFQMPIFTVIRGGVVVVNSMLHHQLM